MLLESVQYFFSVNGFQDITVTMENKTKQNNNNVTEIVQINIFPNIFLKLLQSVNIEPVLVF